MMLSPAYGQQGLVSERVRLELERTEQLLQDASTHASGSPLAEEALRRAGELQREARQLFNQGRYRLSLELTLKAREHLRAFISRNRFGQESDESVLKRLERTSELLERTTSEMSPDLDRGQRALLEAARENLQKAWDLYRAGRFRPAIKLLSQVDNTLHRINRQSGRLDRRNEAFERRLRGVTEQTADFERRLGDCTDDAANTFLDQAQSSLELARKLANEDNIAAAMQALENAHHLVQEGMRLCVGRDFVGSMLNRMQNRFELLSARIPSNDKKAQKFLEQARKQLDLAKEHLDNDRPEAAAASLRAAQQAFQRIARLSREYDI
jgi:hypothetical protein